MTPERYNRLQNTSARDFEEFIAWLTKTVLAEARIAQGNPEATKAAWVAFIRRGLKADLLLGELMELLPCIVPRVGYSTEQARDVVEMLRRINFIDLAGC